MLNLTIVVLDEPTTELGQFELISSCITFAVSLWLSANGISVSLAGLQFEYIPLGLTLLLFALLYFSFRTRPVMQFKSLIIGASFYAGINLALLASTAQIITLMTFGQLIFAFSLCLVALLMANDKDSFFLRMHRFVKFKHQAQIPKYFYLALRSTFAIVGCVILTSVIIVFIGLFINLDSVDDTYLVLNAGPTTTVIIALLHLLILPNYIIYTATLLFSSGFQVGNLAHFALYQIDLTTTTESQVTITNSVETLPPIPLLTTTISHDILQINQFIPIVIISIIAMLITLWQVQRINNELLFIGLTKLKATISNICYKLLTMVITMLLLFLMCVSLVYLASGSVDHNFGYIGADAILFGLDIIAYYAISPVLVIAVDGVIKYSRNDLGSETITRQEVHTAVAREIIKEHENAMKTVRKGKRSVTSKSSTKV